jgi:hypothetical protein
VEKRDDKAFGYRPEGEAKPRAATQVNAISASLTPPAGEPEQLELFPGRASPLKAKPATARNKADQTPRRRDGVQGGSTQRQKPKMTGEVHVGPEGSDAPGREAYKGDRKRRPNANAEVGGGHSSAEGRENRPERRVATFVQLLKQGKIAGLPPRGKAQPRTKTGGRKAPERLDKIRKLQRTLYRVAKCEPQRMNAAGRRWPESRMREIRTYGSMRGSRKRAPRRTAPAPYSTRSPWSRQNRIFRSEMNHTAPPTWGCTGGYACL